MESTQLNEIQSDVVKADAVMNFVETILGAYESGFIDKHTMNLVQLHECARSHIETNYSISMPRIDQKWSEECIDAFRNGIEEDK